MFLFNKLSKIKNINRAIYNKDGGSVTLVNNNNNNGYNRSQQFNRYYLTSPQMKLDEEVPPIKNDQQKQPITNVNNNNNDQISQSPEIQAPSAPEPAPTSAPQQKTKCWCVLSCKLEGKRILSSKIKPIKYEDERAIILKKLQQTQQEVQPQEEPKNGNLGDYNKKILDLNLPLSNSRKQLIEEMIKAKDQYILEQKQEEEEERKGKEEKERQIKENKQLFQTEETGEEGREFPVLNDDDTSIGPIHILYKNQWISTIVERIETSHKDNTPTFVLKIKTPLKLSSEYTFSIESIHSTLDRLLSTGKVKVDYDFDKMFLTKVSSDKDKEFTNWIKCLEGNCAENSEQQTPASATLTKQEYINHVRLLKESLVILRNEILPSIGFENCSIDLVLSKDSIVGCKQGHTELEFPEGTYQLVLEIDSNDHSIWAKSPENVEKILYLYTMMLDSVVSMGRTSDVPLSVSYL
ncbi:hypothetical protein DICPUDRAFT_148240 [Dictyostelium purpureum]|uniref:Uncharacterized protein n=1 Tax=Dictyostelium purpureum TaxID=5786 RepID=F0ZAL7_DICPU|nr:uncharacterized protein DICPUDRAFT_148240 [Dictyostelium purpureum]EGC38997.1 hypothetical protein DICPUDRAFT_148240 [Dictyostelium purpureum]|eukprot:XP_003284450.1 hypothetical protein DICPUDRAFT_148240 [Dictyostelium purpureum]